MIEVGCGPGLHSETISMAFLKGRGSVLVSCDFSKAMVSMMQQRYGSSKFVEIAENKVIIDSETDYANPENTDIVDLQ